MWLMPLARKLGMVPLTTRVSCQAKSLHISHTVSFHSSHSAGATPWPRGVPREPGPAPKLYAWTPENLPGTPTGRYTTRGNAKGRTFILGIGNLGRLYANELSRLAEGTGITLVVHRKTLLEKWVSGPGIEITRSGQVHRATSLDIEWWTEEKPSTGPVREICGGSKIENLIVATKAHDALPQVDRLRAYLDGSSTVAFVQNGMNKMWPPYGPSYNDSRYPSGEHPNWVACVTMHGVYSTGPFSSIHASPADVAIGPVLLNSRTGQDAEYLMGQIVAAPELCGRRVPEQVLWILQLEKLVVNSIINPLTAVLRCRNDQIFATPGGEIEKVMDLLLEEASRVLQALVQDDSTLQILQGDESRQSMLERFATPRLKKMLLGVSGKVKDNLSSMLQDVLAGKQTEIQDFNGWLVETAGYLGGIDMANHKIIISLVEDGVILKEGVLSRHFDIF